MKTCFIDRIRWSGSSVWAQGPAQVVGLGPNASSIRRVLLEEAGRGPVESGWVHLEDGLNYWDEALGRWEAAQELIELTESGAVARYGQHRVIFSGNANDPEGAVDAEIGERVRLRSSVLALRYFDPVSGRNEVMAMVRDTAGELLPPNQVIYRDAFDGVRADILYTYRKRGLEADVVLREVPPVPEDFGIDSLVARLEVVTEFFDPPVPNKRPRTIASVDDPAVRAVVAEPDLIDEELSFGPNRIAQGRAFAWSQRDAAVTRPDEYPTVAKRWLSQADGRTVLIEAVEYVNLFDDLLALPGPKDRLRGVERRRLEWAGMSREGKHIGRWRGRELPGGAHADQGKNPSLPRRLVKALDSEDSNVQPRVLVAGVQHRTNPPEPGLVIDWESVVTGSPNLTFSGNKTYYVGGPVSLYGTTTIEGGTVVKYPRYTNSWNGIIFNGPVVTKTSQYRPAVFTAESDSTVGETIVAGGSPVTTNYFGVTHMVFSANCPEVTLEHLRIKYGYCSLYFSTGLCAVTIIFHQCCQL